MARIDPVDPIDLPAEKRDLLDTLSEKTSDEDTVDHPLEGGTLNVYRTLGRNLGVLEGFRAYGSVVWNESGLTPHERETVILATSYHAGSAYEWHQHVRVALDEGMSPEHILAIASEESDRLDEPFAALVAYVEAFVDDDVDDAIHARLAGHYDEETIVGICALTGCYLGLARLLSSLDVETESEFVGWKLERLELDR
ncbi:carboxymuconolactone decarboxylase family protein [Halorubrum vacuolatum]|uniref:Carboxymuconolactone decarboxylase family protein n=1 Tax=Halorubrum vacuolatum TaxID=63740 RepID=A0A238UQS2_HALVU|nr:carboxymuconolactone decarboxylase family protein [Halorubrum vacuolatum]SNR24502.1 Carboxymuconolactone decarboxylase family protein [Halorubrum vacuolatum]